MPWPISAERFTYLMRKDQKACIGSREGDVMGLCDGAHDLQHWGSQTERIARKNYPKNA